MASIKPVVKNDFIKESGKSTIYIRISHNSKVRYIKTTHEIDPKYMNTDGTISGRYTGSAKLNLSLSILMTEYNTALAEIGPEVRYMDVNTLKKRLENNHGSGAGFVKYTNERIKTLKSEGRVSYAATFSAMLKWVKQYAKQDEITFKAINLAFIQGLQRWLLREEKGVNTIRIYVNCVKAILFHAVDNDIIKMDLMFLRKLEIKQKKTAKRNLTVEQFKLLLSSPMTPERKRTIDMFMLSFYMLGPNFKDMVFWTEKNIKNGRIEYLRYKTKNKKPIEMSVKIVPEARAIIDKYKGDKHLLCFMDDQNEKRVTPRYKDLLRNNNVLLKKISKQLKFEIPKLNTGYARGSVGTLAYKLGIMESTISEMLGHSSGQKITNTYIERDYSKQDEAQRLIIQTISQ